MLSFTICDLINSKKPKLYLQKKTKRNGAWVSTAQHFPSNDFSTVRVWGVEEVDREGTTLRGPRLFFYVGSPVLKSCSGTWTIGYSIPTYVSTFAFLHGSTTPKVNSYCTHLGRNGDF